MKWLLSPKVNGCYKDFTVEEKISPRKYTRGRIVKRGNKYWLVMIRKSEITTKKMIQEVGKFFRISKTEIGYAGMKDKHAITYQYITIPKSCNPKLFFHPKITFISYHQTDKRLLIGDLISNTFQVKIKTKYPERVQKLIEEVKQRGFPNYFDEQRFGVLKQNHKIGKKILKMKKSKFGKEKTKFFIHAYQSWIFNKVLKNIVKTRKKPFFQKIPIVGYNTVLRNDNISRVIKWVLKKEGIELRDFKINTLRLCCAGSSRYAFVKPLAISWNNTTLKFTLPRGSYGTMLLKEFGVKPC